MAAAARQIMLLSSLSLSLSLSQSFSFWFSSVRRHPAKSLGLVRLRPCAFSTDTPPPPPTPPTTTSNKKQKQKQKDKENNRQAKGLALAKEKRRTRSLRYHCDNEHAAEAEEEDGGSSSSSTTTTTTATMSMVMGQSHSHSHSHSHIPVLLGEVVDVFSRRERPLSSFVDCTLGAAGHSSAIIQAHPELKVLIGMDVDPVALQMARSRIQPLSPSFQLQAFTFPNNFRHIKSLLKQVQLQQPDIISSGVDGILMDLGLSSMQVNNPDRGFSLLANGPLDMRMDPQATLTAEDILNSWPDSEVGRILRDYGEESNWRLLQNKIVQARIQGGLHSTGELVDVIRSVAPRSRGGRQGWIKTATRVFQALRIAVNDELKTLEDSLYACFDCLAPGGRLAVISFHSLEDRIVKQTFLKIIDCNMESGDGSVEDRDTKDFRNVESYNNQNESWIRQTIQGCNGIILTKRPITPSEEEEGFNRRSRSAKLRVIQKVCK